MRRRLIFKNILNRANLVGQRRLVRRGGKAFQQLKWVRPAEPVWSTLQTNMRPINPAEQIDGVQDSYWADGGDGRKYLVKPDSQFKYSIGGEHWPSGTQVYNDHRGSTAVGELLASRLAQATGVPTNHVMLGRHPETNQVVSLHREIPNVQTLEQYHKQQVHKMTYETPGMQQLKDKLERWTPSPPTTRDRQLWENHYNNINTQLEEHKRLHPNEIKGQLLGHFVGDIDRHEANILVDDKDRYHHIDFGLNNLAFSPPWYPNVDHTTMYNELHQLRRSLEEHPDALNTFKTTVQKFASLPDSFFHHLVRQLPPDAAYHPEKQPHHILKDLKARRNTFRQYFDGHLSGES